MLFHRPPRRPCSPGGFPNSALVDYEQSLVPLRDTQGKEQESEREHRLTAWRREARVRPSYYAHTSRFRVVGDFRARSPVLFLHYP